MQIDSRLPAFALASVAFFISGFAALTYQIVWQRLLVLPIGADVYSTTIVVAAFMAGLGIGSLVGGQVADRVSPRQCVLLFVAAESAICLFGFASIWVFYGWMYLRLGPVAMHPALTAGIVFVSLLWPTFWMGLSLPVLGRAVTLHVADAAKRVGLLYGLNTLGAGTGAFATTWLLFPRLGLEGSVRFAAVLNVFVAMTVLPIVLVTVRGRLPASASEERAGSTAASTRLESDRWPLSAWIGLYALAGLQALSLEIIWFRVLGVMMKSTAFTFGTLLTIYLAGLGIGAAVGSFVLRRVRRPGRAFLLLQAFVGVYAGVSIAALVSLLPGSTPLANLWAYLGGYEPLNAVSGFATLWSSGRDATLRSQFIELYFVWPAVLVGPPTLAMGASFPLLQKVALVDPDQIGKRVALVLMANIWGSTAGCMLTGWLALTYLGSGGALKVMMGLGGVFLALAVAAGRRGSVAQRRIAAIGVLLLVGAATFRLPSGHRVWASLHGAPPWQIVDAEDATGLSLLKANAAGAVVFVNGIGQSWIPYGNIHTVLGALPAFLHPDPRTAAIIGLGSGDTVHALAGRGELSQVVCIEIIRPQLPTLNEWARRTGYPGLLALFADPRVQHVSGDGRTHIMRSSRTFDIIEADALRPTSAYSGNLYSLGYFALLRSRLAPGGMAVTWAPTTRVYDTFAAVFPHVLSFGDILIGSEKPVHFDADEIRARLRTPAVQAYYWRAAIDIEALLARSLNTPPGRSESQPERRRGDLNDDLYPRDEFSVPD